MASSGGGISNGGTLTLNNCTVSGNSADTDYGGIGGGIYNDGTLTLNNSTVRANHVDDSGGGIFNDYWGTLTLNNSTVSGNVAYGIGYDYDYGGGYGQGGGIFNFSGTLTLNNATVSGNSTDGIYGGIGGGIWNLDGPLTLNNSTVSGNNATFYGGGIASDTDHYGHPFHARNTIIAGNTAPTAPDLGGDLGSLGHNLIGNTSGGSGFDPTDLLNVDPMLGPLQDNGGPTWTMALLPGSPAIDAGDDTPPLPDFDQRGPGFPRISGPHIDIGAFEVQQGSLAGDLASPGGRASGRPHRDGAVHLSLAISPRQPLFFSPSPPTAQPQGTLPGPAAATADQFFARVEEKSAVMSVRWKHREPGEPAGWLLDPLREEDCLFA
jgi:hypothetical protein